MNKLRTKQSKLDRNVTKMIKSVLGEPLSSIYLKTLRHWIKYKGPEWTALRLKALWNCAMLLKSGELDLIPQVCHDNRIGLSSGLPKGIEGVLVRTFALTKKPCRIRAHSVALRSYTAIRLSKPSSKQIAKCRKSITSPGNGLKWYSCTSRDYRHLDRLRADPKFHWDNRVLLLNPFGFKVKAPHLTLVSPNRLSGTSHYPSLQRFPNKEIKERPYLSMLSSMCTKGKVPLVLVDHFGDFRLRLYAEMVQSMAEDETYGNINVIQEGGAKGRVVCSPNAWVQYYCKPYHSYLGRIIARLESHGKVFRYHYGTSCMYDQESGVYLALRKLESGNYASGVDLSSATDRFPLSAQQSICRELGIPEFGEALEELKGPYHSPTHELWTYGAGQPMGLYGSFPLFHLTHYCLLNGLSYKLGLPNDWSNFAVLGDDVIVFNKELHDAYLKALEVLGVPVSYNKSFEGNLVEFAGFTITRSQGGWTAYRPYKYGPNGEMSSPLNVLHALGSATRQWGSQWKKAYQEYQRSMIYRSLDLSPHISENDSICDPESLPTGNWLSSLLQRIRWQPVVKTRSGGGVEEFSIPLDLDESWVKDRYGTRQTCIDSNSLFEEEVALFSIKLQDEHNTFSPERYNLEDLRRKKFWKTFYQDPCISQIMQS